jgi:hypothetical protein
MGSMTVRSVCLRHLPSSTEHPKPFDAGLVKIGSCPSARNCELLIIGNELLDSDLRNVYIQETVTFMRAFGREHAC